MNNLTFLQNFVPVQSSPAHASLRAAAAPCAFRGALAAAELLPGAGAASQGLPCTAQYRPGSGSAPRVGACRGLLLPSTPLPPCRKPAPLPPPWLEGEKPKSHAE